jgi:hypothetical protein
MKDSLLFSSLLLGIIIIAPVFDLILSPHLPLDLHHLLLLLHLCFVGLSQHITNQLLAIQILGNATIYE